MKGNLASLALITVLAGLFSGTAVAGEDLVFSTAPTQSAEETVKLYGPLMDYLHQSTGKRFVIKPAKTFIEYNNKTQRDGYDLVFDGPHFTGWRMDRQGAVPLARLPGMINIVIAIRADSTINRLEDLIARKACSFASPNMLTMALLSNFRDPARQPTMINATSFKEVGECLKSGRGDAAVLRQEAWAKMDQTGLRTLQHEFRGYPERSFSASGRIDAETREKLKAALLSPDAAKAAVALLESFKKPGFVATEPSEYRGLGELLAPVWGFQ